MTVATAALEPAPATPLLTLAKVKKSFGGTQALRDANLALYPGQVTALIGENGAGKSTLVKILCGFHQPDGGEILLDGRPVSVHNAEHARQLGINVVHQECVVFDNLSVAENIFVSARPKQGRFVSWRDMRARAAEILRQLDVSFTPDLPAGQLSVAQKHIVQIARALTSDARVLILDEPTAALSHREAEDLFRIVRRLKESGCALLFISHKFDEIFSLADRYAVFRDGSAVGAGMIAETNSEQLIRLMVGRSVDQLFPKVAHDARCQSCCAWRIFAALGEFDQVSFSVKRGETLGIYGLVGAGRTELAQCLFGLTAPDCGSVYIDGKPV